MATDKRIAVVTGAAKGIGLETVRQLEDRGLHVILTARTDEALAEGLHSLGNRDDIEGHLLDVADQASVDTFFDWLRRVHGRIDVLVNNAGRDPGGFRNALGTSAATILETFDNNALSAWQMIQQALPLMNANGYGRIVNVSSGMGQLSEMGSGVAAYRISKTAMNAVTRIAANEARGNVKINSVCPGWVRTDMGGPSANRSVEHGASGVVWAATLPEDGPSGGFFRDGRRLDW